MWRMWAKTVWVGMGVVCIGVTVALSDEARVHGTVGWFNRYVTEGMDHVPESDFLLADVTLDLKGVVVGAFWAEALDDSYNEVNLSAIHPFRAGALDFFLGVGRNEFPSGADQGSWEVLGGAEWVIPNLVTLFAETWYDFDALKGGFLEAGMIREFGGRLSFEPYVLMGLDYGFVSGPRRLKENHVQFGGVAYWAWTSVASLFGGIHHSVALTNLDGEGEGDVTWGGGGLQLSF